MAGMSADLAALDLVRDVIVEDTALAEQFQWFAAAATFLLLASVAARVFGVSPSRSLGLTSVAALAASLLVASGLRRTRSRTVQPRGRRPLRSGRVRPGARLMGATRSGWPSAPTPASTRAYTSTPDAPCINSASSNAPKTETLAALRSDAPALRALAWFHTGNHRWSNQDLLGARLAYIEALRESPSLLDAKINLELINALLAAPEDDADRATTRRPPRRGRSSGPVGRNPTSPTPTRPAGAGRTRDKLARQAMTTRPHPPPGRATEPDPSRRPSPTRSRCSNAARRRCGSCKRRWTSCPSRTPASSRRWPSLDALRAVPGERLAAGSLQFEGQPLDW